LTLAARFDPHTNHHLSKPLKLKEKIVYHYSALVVYFIVWLSLCSYGFKPELLVQALLITLAYLVSVCIGFKKGKILLSVDGPHTLIIIPAALIGLAVSSYYFEAPALLIYSSIACIFVSLIVGHLMAMGTALLLGTILDVE